MNWLRALVLSAGAMFTGTTGCSSIFASDFDGYRAATGGAHGSVQPSEGGAVTSGAGAGGRSGGASGGGASGFGGASPPDASVDGSHGDSSVDGSHGDASVDGSRGDASVRDSAGTGPTEAGDPDAMFSDPPGTRWKSAPDSALTRIPLCFTTTAHRERGGPVRCTGQTGDSACSGAPFDGTGRDAMRRAFATLVQNNWARAANLQFTGLGDCSSAGSGVYESDGNGSRIAVTFVTRGHDAEPLTRVTTGFGNHEDFATDVHVDWIGLRDGDPDTLRAILREIGHALAFPYEWARSSQAVACVPPDPQRELFGYLPPDVDSVMDRCEPHGPAVISAADTVGAIYSYGVVRPKSLVGYRGQCVGVPQGDQTPGAQVTVEPCANEGNALWSRNPLGPPRFEAVFDPTRCLSVRGGAVSETAPTPVVSAKCDESPEQIMRMEDLEWRSDGNRCLAAKFGSVTLAQCDGSQGQRWNFWNSDPANAVGFAQIQATSTSDCVTAQTDAGANLEQMILTPCSTSNARQQFPHEQQGFLQYGDTLFCLNVLGSAFDPGEILGLYDNGCGSIFYYPNSSFYVSGRLKMMGQCLSVRGHVADAGDDVDVADTGADVVVEPCDETKPAQVWDYHF